MFEQIFNRLGKRKLCCAVVTPVGPGHAQAYRDCERSINAAWRCSRGPFTALDLLAIDDSTGRLGRSGARNEGVKRATETGAEWIFFLDADDLMLPEAFGQVSDLIESHDAIWGLIHSCKFGASDHHLRLPQILSMSAIESLVVFDPFLTLQMGHFVRTAAALATPFDSSMDAGEDFDYYLRLWRNFRCTKVPRAFFVARQGQRSKGPRSATAQDWGTTVRSRLLYERTRLGLAADSRKILDLKNAAVHELQSFYRNHALANATNYVALSREMPFRGMHRIEVARGRAFEMYSDNDDPVCLSFAWTGEYRYISSRLWEALARAARIVMDIGAGTGYYSLLAAVSADHAEQKIVCYEARPSQYERLIRNIGINKITNITPLRVAVGREHGATDIPTHASPTSAADSERTESATLIHINEFMHEHRGPVELMRIEAIGSELSILTAMQSMIAADQPDIVMHSCCIEALRSVENLLDGYGYRIFVVDEDADTLVSSVTAADVSPACTLWATVRSASELREITQQAEVASVSD